MRIERHAVLGGTEVVVEGTAGCERLVSLVVPSTAQLESTLSRLATHLGADVDPVIKIDASGSLEAWSASVTALQRALPTLDAPITWVDGAAGDQLTLRLHSVSGASVRTVELDAGARARVYSDAYADYCVVGNLLPEPAATTPVRQARSVFERLSQLLELGGCRISDLARTWFYLDRIWECYGEFNSVRESYYRAHGLFERGLPASTGVGAANPAGTALVASALGVRPRHPEASFRVVPSPLQCSPMDYGSSFSRAVEFLLPGEKRLLVSGTASIARDGSSTGDSDLDAQVAHTMRSVHALLGEQGLTPASVIRAVAYFQRAQDADHWRRHAQLGALPLVATRCDICRPELLFEIEVDAAKSLADGASTRQASSGSRQS